MKVSFEGVGEQVLSFNKASGVTKGALVKMSANSTVKACDAGDRFMGICIASGDAFAEVKTAGYVELGYSGTAPTVGYATLAADAAAHGLQLFGRTRSDEYHLCLLMLLFIESGSQGQGR